MSDLASDFANAYVFAVDNWLGRRMFDGIERIVTDAIERLSQHDADMIIAIPVKNKANLATVFSNLTNIDLPLKTGVLFALDEFNDHDWRLQLESKIRQVGSRFVFVETVITGACDMMFVVQDMREIVMLKINQELAERYMALGMRSLKGRPDVVFKVIRETLRLIIKGLNCKYVLWFDADEQAPRDVVARLRELIEGKTKADIASGWAIDRHYPFDKTTFEMAKPYAAETQEELDYLNQANQLLDKMTVCMNNVLRMHGICTLGVGRDHTAHVIAPSRVRRESAPIEIDFTGFGCVLMKKQVNDNCSFISLDDDSMHAEDVTFCAQAHSKGYRLFVDPTCFCEHVTDAPNIIK